MIFQTGTLTSTTPQKISTFSGKFNSATFFGYATYSNGVPVPATGTVFLGTQSGQCPVAILSGSFVDFTLAPNRFETLDNLWFVGYSGAGVSVLSYL